MNFKELQTEQKLRGGYYTPEDLADFLTRWVAGVNPESILEASCGDGVFFNRIASHMGNQTVTAFEIDVEEAKKAGKFPMDELSGVAELPTVLIKARIAQGLSQKDLAERLGLQEQQIQRYEATEYASAGLTRIKEVVSALGAATNKPAITTGP